MKKAVSLILIAISLLLGNTPMHASHKHTKAWAYTKIGLGWATGIGSVPLFLMTFLSDSEEKLQQAKKDLSDSRILTRTDALQTIMQINLNKGADSSIRILSVPLLPLGILLVKSGKRDLRRIRKQEAREAAQV